MQVSTTPLHPFFTSNISTSMNTVSVQENFSQAISTYQNNLQTKGNRECTVQSQMGGARPQRGAGPAHLVQSNWCVPDLIKNLTTVYKLLLANSKMYTSSHGQVKRCSGVGGSSSVSLLVTDHIGFRESEIEIITDVSPAGEVYLHSSRGV